MKHSFTYTIALASAVVGLPQNADPGAKDPGLPTAQGVHRIYVHKSCNDNEQKQIAESFYDAQKLANALKSWEPAGKNQEVMNMYMGTKSSWQGDPVWPLGSNYRKIIKNNIDREAALYEPHGWTDNRLYIMCHEDEYFPDKSQSKCPPTGTYAWTWNDPGKIWTDHYMTFCPLFFNSPSLSSDVQKGQNDKNAAKFLDGFDTNRGATFFHESFHLDWTVGNPSIVDNPDGWDQPGVYGPGMTADWAEKRNAAATMLIAESYTMAGLAIYYRDTLGLSDFPKPKGRASSNVIRKKLPSPITVQGATDPNDSNSKPSNDWIPIVDFNDPQVSMDDELGQPAQCRAETIQASNAAYLLSDGKTKTDITSIAYSLRQVLCSDKCVLPAGITGDNARVTPTDDGNGCEISVAMPNQGEIYLYRKTHAQGEETQECWDYTQVLFQTCLIRGPNASDGWVNGLHQNQFYQGGLRKINDPSSAAVKAGHPLDTSKTLQFAPSSGHDRR